MTGAAAEALSVGDMPTPMAGPGEVRVRLEAPVSIPPMSAAAPAAIGPWISPVIPNSDGAGIVDQIGDGVTRFNIGTGLAL